MVYEVGHDELGKLIEFYYNSKLPLMVYGTFGIGKSQSGEKKAKDLAEKKEKKYVNWNKISMEEKINVIENAKEYFIYLDIRLSEFDASDIKGLPELQASDKFKNWLVWRVPLFAKLLENPDTDGILNFDEMNLAPPLIQSACYKIIHDRIVNDSKISDNWLIMGAGNTDEDRAYIHEMAPPLRDRFGEVMLRVPVTDSWIDNFAIPVGINPLIIGFLAFKTAAIHKVDFDDNQKFTTPRGWERLSNLLANNKSNNFDDMDMMAKSAIGEGIAQEFVSFCKISKKINMEDIIKNPEKITKVEEINIKWFINTALSEKYKDKKVTFDKILEFSRIMDKNNDVELVAYLWKMCSSLSNRFKKDFLAKLDVKDDLVQRYSKYLG